MCRVHVLADPQTLALLRARPVVLAVHSDRPFQIRPIEFDQGAFEASLELPIVKYGDCSILDYGRIKLYLLKSGYGGVSFAVQNCVSATEPWKAMDSKRTMLFFCLDCSSSINTMSHRGNLSFTAKLSPGEIKILHHLTPIDPSQYWDWGYEASIKWAIDD